jgi:hypothetical protein
MTSDAPNQTKEPANNFYNAALKNCLPSWHVGCCLWFMTEQFLHGLNEAKEKLCDEYERMQSRSDELLATDF